MGAVACFDHGTAEQRAKRRRFLPGRGLRDGQFYDWKKRLRRHETESFVAVEIAATETPAAPLPATPVPSAVIGIRLRRGRSLLVGPDFEAAHLQRLLQVLEQEL